MPEAPGDKTKPDLSSLRIDRTRDAGLPGGGTRRLLLGLLLLAILVAIAGVSWRFRDVMVPAPEVRTARARVVSPARADSILTASGYLVSRTQAAIGAKVSGRVEAIRVEEGDRVGQGQVLAVLEHADLEAGLAAAEAGLSRAEADVLEAETLLVEDERDLVRKGNLFRSDVGSRQDWEQAEARRDAAAARLEALRRQVVLTEAQARERAEILENMFIRAPFPGTVISKDAEVGETITPGGMGAASGRGSVVTLADLDHLEVETDVKEDFIGRLGVGQPARVEVDAVPDRRYEGRLRQIIPMGDRSRAVIQVKVEVLDADEALFPEMSASVHFLPSEADAAVQEEERPRVFVPPAAVDRDGEEGVVWLVRDGRVQSRRVSAGVEREGQVEIRDGLSGGEILVLNPPADLVDGAKIRVEED